MLKVVECPACKNYGLNVDIEDGQHIKTSGKPLREFPCVTVCAICKRKIKYEIVKDEK